MQYKSPPHKETSINPWYHSFSQTFISLPLATSDNVFLCNGRSPTRLTLYFSRAAQGRVITDRQYRLAPDVGSLKLKKIRFSSCHCIYFHQVNTSIKHFVSFVKYNLNNVLSKRHLYLQNILCIFNNFRF